MKWIGSSCALFCVLLACLGCNSGPEYEWAKRQISIDTVPGGAEVYQDNIFDADKKIWLGTTPLVDSTVAVLTGMTWRGSARDLPGVIASTNSVAVTITKDGYQPYRSRLGVKEDETVKHVIELEPVNREGVEVVIKGQK